MSPLLLFILLLFVTFGVLFLVLRPTKTEADIERHLVDIGRASGTENGETTILKQEPLTAIPILDGLLRKLRGTTALQRLIEQAGLTWPVTWVVLTSALATLVAGWIASAYIPVVLLVLLVAVGVGSIPFIYLFQKRSYRFHRFEDILPEAIDLMSRALKSGHSVTSMIEMVAQETSEPVASEFRIVFEEQNLGLPMREAMLHLAARVPLQDVHFLVMAILVQKETGGNLAEILDKAAVIMRERMRLHGQLRVYTAQGRMSGWVLCLLPFVMALLLTVVNPAYEKKLWTHPMGIHFMYVGLAMMAIGILVVRHIVDIRV